MKPRTRYVAIAAGIVVTLLAVYSVADLFFLPEGQTRADENAPLGAMDAGETLARGIFEGKAGHHVAGNVELVRIDGAHYLHFVDYEQTAGPDVYIYLTPARDADTASEIDAGVKILIDGGADGGESTKVGTFYQRIPDHVDVHAYHGVAAWCDRFDTPFGTAPLEPSEAS